MMLFQIEEPDGSPLDEPTGPGASVGVDLTGATGRVAIAVGGNAEMLASRDPPERETAAAAILLLLRGLAERALGRPVTHAVVVVPPLGESARQALTTAAAAGGITVTRLLAPDEAAALAPGAAPDFAALYGAAIAAEDDAFTAQQHQLQP
jgi:molecular chaperone DnaK (HSP70)